MIKKSYCYLVIIITFTGVIGCQKLDTQEPIIKGVADLNHYRQRVSAYIKNSDRETLLPVTDQNKFDSIYNKKFFSPWHQKKATLEKEKAFEGGKHFFEKEGYAENLRPFPRQEWELLLELQNINKYPSLARPAIIIRDSSLRLFPTRRPFFLDPKLPGEGFPFDYFQTSVIAFGTPIFATHRTSDGAWIFVESSFAFGWVPTDDVAWVDTSFTKQYESGKYAAVLQDDTSFFTPSGQYIAQTDLGSIFPLISEKGNNLTLNIPVRNINGGAELKTAVVDNTRVRKKPLPLTPGLIAELADSLMGQKYGWGGLYGNRDCSSTMRDLFTPFGIWLDRNSQQQGLHGGEFIDLRDKTPSEKENEIRNKGIPLATLIWLKGHIGLYLGTDPADSNPLLLHNLWGVRTKKVNGQEGREIIGRLVISSLRIGEERPDVEKDAFYGRVLGITILTKNNDSYEENKKGLQ